MKAVIVAAGMSRRMGTLTTSTPKCLLPVGDRTLIEYSLRALKRVGIVEVGFVVGYLKEAFPAKLGDGYEYIFNPFYATTNDMASLWFAKHFVEGSDFVYLHSDLLYHPDILTMTVSSQVDIALAVEKTDCDEEMMKVRVGGLDLLESGKDIPVDQAFGEWTGIAKFTVAGWKKYLPEVEQLLSEGQFDAYDTAAFNRLARKERIIQVVPFQGLPFIEIDYPEDLHRGRNEILPRIDGAQSKRVSIGGTESGNGC
jgi:choline kinase